MATTPQGFQYIATWQRLFCQATLEGWASVRGDGLQMGLEESQQLPLHGLEENISSLCSLAPKNVGHSAIHDLVDARDSYPFTPWLLRRRHLLSTSAETA